MNYHSEEQREEIQMAISLWRESGLSQGAFCRREGIARSTFQSWRRRYDSTYESVEQKANTASKTAKQSFIALEMKGSVISSTDDLEIIYPNGVRVKCKSTTSDERLRSLVLLQSN